MSRETLLVIAAVGALTACSDANPSLTSPQSAPAARYVEPIDGEPTYYEYDTTISGTGGLPGWENPAEAHARSLKEIYRWSSSTSHWDIENQFPTAEHQFDGYVNSNDVDVAQAYKQINTITATNRSGYNMYEDTRPPIDRIQHGYEPAGNRVPVGLALGRAPAVAARPDAPKFTPAEIRASRADRLIVTAPGKTRELALLRRQFGHEGTVNGKLLEFRRTQGTEELRVHFDSSVGAVTRMVLYEGQHKKTETVRQYRHDGRAWLLTSIVTETFDSTGKRTSRFVKDIRNIDMR